MTEDLHWKTISDVRSRARQSRRKFPGNRLMLAALVEELGELARAMLEGRQHEAREEALDVACVALRLLEEGDADLDVGRTPYVQIEREHMVTSHLNAFDREEWKGLSEDVRRAVCEAVWSMELAAEDAYDRGHRDGFSEGRDDTSADIGRAEGCICLAEDEIKRALDEDDDAALDHALDALKDARRHLS